MSSPSTRKQCDFTKLIMGGYELDLQDGNAQDFYVTFFGPKDTIYEGAIYRIHVELPEQYPFASPSVGFEPYSIFHPNVDERSGSVCLDVINQTWTPLYSLINIFDVFLPQLLTYPNPADPLNADAASMFVRDRAKYDEKVKAYVQVSVNRYEERMKLKDAASSRGSNDINVSDVESGPEVECAEFEMREDGSDLDGEFD